MRALRLDRSSDRCPCRAVVDQRHPSSARLERLFTKLGASRRHALHLAIASEHGATVQTLDQRLAEAGPALAVPAQLLVNRGGLLEG